MGSARLKSPAGIAIVVAIAATTLLCGCNGEDNNVVALRGGVVTGQTIDAAAGVGLGGVFVAIGTMQVLPGDPAPQFVAAATGVSTTPNGVYQIKDVPAGTYTVLRVTPSPELYGGPQVWPINVTVASGQTVQLGPVLVTDDAPPEPIDN